MTSYLSFLMCVQGPVGSVFFFRKKEVTNDPKKSDETTDSSMLCKFVVDGSGKRIGESVSIDHDVLIIKSGVHFLGIPLKHVELAEKILVVRGLLDFTKAYELGEKWRKESCREMKPYGGPEDTSHRG